MPNICWFQVFFILFFFMRDSKLHIFRFWAVLFEDISLRSNFGPILKTKQLIDLWVMWLKLCCVLSQRWLLVSWGTGVKGPRCVINPSTLKSALCGPLCSSHTNQINSKVCACWAHLVECATLELRLSPQLRLNFGYGLWPLAAWL